MSDDESNEGYLLDEEDIKNFGNPVKLDHIGDYNRLDTFLNA